MIGEYFDATNEVACYQREAHMRSMLCYSTNIGFKKPLQAKLKRPLVSLTFTLAGTLCGERLNQQDLCLQRIMMPQTKYN